MLKSSSKLTAIITVFIMVFTLLGIYPSDSPEAAVIPKLQMVSQPAKEYKPGDRISFVVTSPNYGGKVQYRVILYNGTTKKTSELWKTPKTGYYYTNWMPSGNYKFTISWPAIGMEPGAYSLTVLVKRAGTIVPYDSYVKTSAFWIKAVNESNPPDNSSTTNPSENTPPDTQNTLTNLSVAAGDEHYMVLKNGTLWSQGNNYYGQLGITAFDKYPDYPAWISQVGFDNDWIKIFTGYNQSFGIKQDGSLWAWGNNSDGQLGMENNPPSKQFNKPTLVSRDGNWDYISSGWMHSAAIKKDGSLWAWGNNSSGLLGDGTTETRMQPIQIGSDKDWAKVYAGWGATFAIKKDGSLWGLGNINGYVQTPPTASPVRIGEDNDWIETGDYVAQKKDGTLWTWGSYALANTSSDSSPVKINESSDWKDFFIRRSVLFGIKNNGTLWKVVKGGEETQIGTSDEWDYFADGNGYPVLVKKDGTIWGIGPNNDLFPDRDIKVDEVNQLSSIAPLKPLPAPEIQWKGQYGGANDDVGYITIPLRDGGFLTAGTVEASAGNTNIFIAKTDSSGKKQWEKTFGGTYKDMPYSIEQTSDEGYILLGNTTFNDYGGTGMYIIKTDKYGNKQWEKSYIKNFRTLGGAIQQTSDGGYLAAGKSPNPSVDTSTLYLVKFDSAGNKKWDKYIDFGMVNGMMVQDMVKTRDGKFVILANNIQREDMLEPYTKENTIYLLKVDSDGKLLWKHTYGNSDYGYSLSETKDGSFIISGVTWEGSYDATRHRSLLLKADSAGVLEWKRSINVTYDAFFLTGAIESYDGGFITVGTLYETFGSVANKINQRIIIIKTDNKGQRQWAKDFRGAGNAEGYSIIKASGGGYIVTGSTEPYTSAPGNIYIFKIQGEN